MPRFRFRKVPALASAIGNITENSAILTYIAALSPEAGLFPVNDGPFSQARRATGLSFCSATLHPIVRGLFNPSRLTTGDGEPVREKARELADKAYAFVEMLLERETWWLGVESIIDVYLAWTVSVAKKGHYDFSRFPCLDKLETALEARPAFARTMARELEFAKMLQR